MLPQSSIERAVNGMFLSDRSFYFAERLQYPSPSASRCQGKKLVTFSTLVEDCSEMIKLSLPAEFSVDTFILK